MLPALASSSQGEKWGGQGPTWLLEGQTPVAGVLLELDLLQGEEGGSCGQRGHRPGDRSVSRLHSRSLRPLAHQAQGAGHPFSRAGSPRMTGFAPLVKKENPGTGSQVAQPNLGPGLWALLPPHTDPLPRSRIQGGAPSLALALTVFQLVHALPQRPEVGVPQGRLC